MIKLNEEKYAELKAASERAWRNGELARSDIELNKALDGRGTVSVAQWGEYRNALRDWSEAEAFPDEAGRPAAPDAVVTE